MVTAREDGSCEVCTGPYAAGDELGLVLEGWAHLECSGWITSREAPC